MSDTSNTAAIKKAAELSLDPAAVDQLFDGVYAVGRDKRIRGWNRAAEQITGFARAEMLGRTCQGSPVFHADSDESCLCSGSSCPLFGQPPSPPGEDIETRLRHRDGYIVPVLMRSLRVDTGDLAGGHLVIFRENIAADDAQRLIKKLRMHALIDVLTGLPNRRFLERRLNKRLDELRRMNHRFGLLFADIDDFKAVNDHYGHDVGDGVLRHVGEILASTVRSYDTVGRWGGEEFIIALSEVDASSLMYVAEKIRRAVEQSVVEAAGHKIWVTLSLGATLARIDDNLDELLRRSDVLMYLSKKHGKNCVTLDPQVVVEQQANP